MTTTTSPIRGLSRWAASAAGLLRIYFLPLVVSALAATVWLMVVVAVTEATGSVLLVLALVALPGIVAMAISRRSEEHTSELQSRGHLVCRLLLEKKNKTSEQR